MVSWIASELRNLPLFYVISLILSQLFGNFLYFVTLLGLPLNLGARKLALVTSFIFCIFSHFLKISKCYLPEMSF